MSRNSTPSPPIIVKKKQNSVANVARSFVRQQENAAAAKKKEKLRGAKSNFIKGTSVSGIKLKARANQRRSKRSKTKK